MRNATDIEQQSHATGGARPPSRLREYARLMRLDRPIGIWLLLWPVLWALWISGSGHPDERLFVIFVLGTFVMRSAGCVMNDFADREFDPHVRRTADRPLARQAVSPAEALGLFAVLALVALALVIPLNRPTQVLALIGGVLAVTYPFLKRFFSLPQAYLGLAFSWSVPMAFAAQTGELPLIAWVLFVSGVLWTTAYDTMYAMVDREDDLVIGIRSSAILFGRADRVVVGALQVGALGGLALVGRMAQLGHWYWVGLAVAAALAVHQQVLIRDREPDRCFRAFLNNNLFGLVVFAGIALDYLFRG
jgi:4-hydroxybenzoate polyprenyltransferase